MTRLTFFGKSKPKQPASDRTSIRKANKAGLPTHFADLAEMLTYKRPAYSASENQFIERYIDSMPDMQMDPYGNRYVFVGDKPRVMFSCHTDTVHATDGRQKVYYDAHRNELFKNDTECLGADDGVGVWIMRNLIKANVPGLYYFHQAEEIGGQGSEFVATEYREILTDIDFCIAFDRRGNADVITHQAGGRCCSDNFAQDFSIMLNNAGATKYKPCDGGVFTDSASYTHLISECTNLSVGYYSEHSKHEYVNLTELETLMTALLAIDWAQLEAYRDPKAKDDDWYYHDPLDVSATRPGADYDTIMQFVINNPTAAADLLFDFGATVEDLDYSAQFYKGDMLQ